MLVKEFLNQLETNPGSVEFENSMSVIEANYIFVPASFRNGEVINQIGDNMGSCKIFAFGQIHQLSEEQTLACFGKNYREDVLMNPDADNHQNIRSFMQNGWSGVEFTADYASLTPKN